MKHTPKSKKPISIFQKFIELMKSEPKESRKKKRRFVWSVDESKCLQAKEVKKLREYLKKAKTEGLRRGKFTSVRNWFMVELGLNAGLRVGEMASLKHGSLLLEGGRSSIVVIGKGRKKRSIWISSSFKKTCHAYIGYKKKFGYEIDADSYLLNNRKGVKISKRALQKFFKEIIVKAKLAEHYYIHCLRHTYATFLLKSSSNNYRFVKEQLGHASIVTTEVYASVIESEGRNAVERLFKRS